MTRKRFKQKFIASTIFTVVATGMGAPMGSIFLFASAVMLYGFAWIMYDEIRN